MSDLTDMFFQECDDLLEALSIGLADLESGCHDDDTVNSMFRAVHSIKGGAGAFGLDHLVKFSHAMENVLDDVRSGKLAAGETVVSLLFTSADHLSDLVDAARENVELPTDLGASILGDLRLACSQTKQSETADAPEDVIDFQPLALSLDGGLPPLDDLIPAGGKETVQITFKAHPKLYENGHDPALLIRSLQLFGQVSVAAETDALGPLTAAPWSAAQLTWKITIECDDAADITAIEDVFEFVDGLCDIDIQIEPFQAEIDLAPLEPFTGDGDASGNEELVSDELCEPALEAPSTKQSSSPKASHRTATIRVDLDRVDTLINLAGELVIAETMLRQSVDSAQTDRDGRIEDAMAQLKQLSGAIQECVMAIRAQPVRGLFQRMSRIVREAAKEAGKSARLVTSGDATEVDKTVIERLVDPLTHMIRNAVDHGLETPEQRQTANKDERGIVTLDAAHRSGRLVITLSDDGAGVNRAKVREIAEAKGLIRPEDELSAGDIDNLLFNPGFSTAEEVSSLSGRGVGMDVVRKEIQSLGGRVSLRSKPGKGTTLTISLPLTLAVLEGMIVHVEEEVLIVPTLPLREMLQPGQAQIHELCDGDQVLSLGEDLVPISDLGTELGYRQTPGDLGSQSLLLIEGDSGKRSALAVDAISDQREVVIKGIEQNYQKIPGIAAATILGDGDIALIVDTDQMLNTVKPTSTVNTDPKHEGEILHV